MILNYSITHTKNIFFEFVKIGELPLWSPSEALGYTLIFNPFAQYFYLPSWLLYLLGLLIGDLSKHTYFLYTIFGLSIYNVGQYFWLRKLNIDKKYCLLATIITCFGLKLTEILRFPNAVHTFAWFPWILYSITLSLQNSKTIKSSIIIFISTLMVLTAGYPYYILYGFILFSSYFLFINIPKVKIQIGHNFAKNSFHKSIFTCLLPALIAFLIVLPWFSGINDVMEITRDRNLNDIKFSYILGSSFLDQVGSWILPPISIAEGHYYFGAIISMLIIYYFYCFFNGKINNSIEKYFLIFFLVFFIVNFQIAAPESSIIFNFLWSKLEIIQSFRAYSRMNILLVPLMSVLICYSIKNLDENIINKKDLFVVLLISLVVISLQFYFIEISQSKTSYWMWWQENRLDYAANFVSQKFQLASIIFKSYNNYIYSIFFLLSLIVFAVSNQIKKKVIFYLLILVFVIVELFILANIQWAIPKGYHDENGYNKLNLKPLNTLKNSFTKKRVSTEVKGNTYFRNQRQFNINYFDNFGIDAHTILYDKYFDRLGVFKKDIKIFLADPDGSSLFDHIENGELKSSGSSITEGIGSSRVTANFAKAKIDGAFKVTDEEALPVLYDLIQNEGLSLGTSCAINVTGAIKLGKKLGPGKTIVTILCDRSDKYSSKLFNKKFLQDKGLPFPEWI